MKYRIFVLLIPIFLLYGCYEGGFSSDNEMSSTQSGSYAIMLTISDFLYVVNKTQITTFDVKDPQNPIEVDKQEVGFEIESLYHYNGLLLIGSAENMYIYRIGPDGIPLRESSTTYAESFGGNICMNDPIVARDGLAYVTLSANPTCFRMGFNELRVYDIKNIKSPKLRNTINMASPRGLGLGKNHLFVCDRFDGLVVFNLDDPTFPVKVADFSGFEGFDLIVRGDLLIVVAKDRLLQYDITDETNIKYLGAVNF
jgi:hypothetical protein